MQLTIAALTSLVANAMKNKGSKQFEPEEFMVSVGAKKETGWRALKAKFMSLGARMKRGG